MRGVPTVWQIAQVAEIPGGDMRQVRYQKMDDVGKLCGRLVRILGRRHGIQISRQHERRHVRKHGMCRQRIPLWIRGRWYWPVEARCEWSEVGVRRERFVEGERREQIRPIPARVFDRAIVLSASLCRWGAQIVEQRILCTDDRLILPVTEINRVAD